MQVQPSTIPILETIALNYYNGYSSLEHINVTASPFKVVGDVKTSSKKLSNQTHSFAMYENSSELIHKESQNIGLNVEGPATGTSGSGSLGISLEQSTSKKESYLRILGSFETQNRREELDVSTLQALQLTDSAQNLLSTNPVEFVNRYGDSMVTGFIYGGKFATLQVFETKTEEDRRVVKVNVKASGKYSGIGGGGNVEVSNEDQKKFSSIVSTTNTKSEGITAPSVNLTVDEYKKFLEGVIKEDGKQIFAILTPYEKIDCFKDYKEQVIQPWKIYNQFALSLKKQMIQNFRSKDLIIALTSVTDDNDKKKKLRDLENRVNTNLANLSLVDTLPRIKEAFLNEEKRKELTNCGDLILEELDKFLDWSNLPTNFSLNVDLEGVLYPPGMDLDIAPILKQVKGSLKSYQKILNVIPQDPRETPIYTSCWIVAGGLQNLNYASQDRAVDLKAYALKVRDQILPVLASKTTTIKQKLDDLNDLLKKTKEQRKLCLELKYKFRAAGVYVSTLEKTTTSVVSEMTKEKEAVQEQQEGGKTELAKVREEIEELTKKKTLKEKEEQEQTAIADAKTSELNIALCFVWNIGGIIASSVIGKQRDDARSAADKASSEISRLKIQLIEKTAELEKVNKEIRNYQKWLEDRGSSLAQLDLVGSVMTIMSQYCDLLGKLWSQLGQTLKNTIDEHQLAYENLMSGKGLQDELDKLDQELKTAVLNSDFDAVSSIMKKKLEIQMNYQNVLVDQMALSKEKLSVAVQLWFDVGSICDVIVKAVQSFPSLEVPREPTFAHDKKYIEVEKKKFEDWQSCVLPEDKPALNEAV